VSLLDNLPHQLTFSRQTYTRGSIGGQLATPAAYATGKEGWVQSASHREINEFQKRGQAITHKVLMAPDDEALLTEGDTITVTAGDTFVGHILQVRSSGEATAGCGWLSSVYVEKL